jgi:hypothetical protein
MWAANACDAPAESWQPRSAVHALARRNGWRVDKLKIDALGNSNGSSRPTCTQ